MALPIWGRFMKKCLADSTLGMTEDDRFVSPGGMSVNIDCSGGDISQTGEAGNDEKEQSYFD